MVPYLYGLKPEDVPGTSPSAQFQMVTADLAGTTEMMQGLNRRLREPLLSQDVEEACSLRWQQLAGALEAIQGQGGAPAAPARRQEEMLGDILNTVREIARRPWPTASLYPSRRERGRTRYLTGNLEGPGDPELDVRTTTEHMQDLEAFINVLRAELSTLRSQLEEPMGEGSGSERVTQAIDASIARLRTLEARYAEAAEHRVNAMRSMIEAVVPNTTDGTPSGRG